MYLQKVICRKTYIKKLVPDPHQNVMDPQHSFSMFFLVDRGGGGGEQEAA
jgi:hypothetical protein